MRNKQIVLKTSLLQPLRGAKQHHCRWGGL